MWNCTVLPSVVGICRITPRTCAVDWVSTIVFLISQFIKPVCMWCLGIPALTWFSRFCHVYSPKVFPTNRIILSNAFQWACHCRKEEQNAFKMQYQYKKKYHWKLSDMFHAGSYLTGFKSQNTLTFTSEEIRTFPLLNRNVNRWRKQVKYTKLII